MTTALETLRSAPELAGAAGRYARDLFPEVARGVALDLRHRASAADTPRSTPRTGFDPQAYETLVDPYRHLPAMHEHPVWVNEQLNVWILTGYEDLRKAGLDNEILSSGHGIFLRTVAVANLITRDRPDHTRLRGVTAKLFTRAGVEGLRPDIEALSDKGIDRLLQGQTNDAVEAICSSVPMSAIAVILGVPPERWREFRRWAEPLSQVFNPRTGLDVARMAARSLPAMTRFRHLVESELAQRAHDPQDDVLGVLHRAQVSGALDDTEAFLYTVILLVAGQETTGNLLGSMISALSQRPELYQRLREDRSLIPNAIEEFTRWSSPVQWVTRWTLESYEVAGHVIPANARVMLPWVFGNRDPRRYENPDVLDIDRDAKGHLGFGSGIHFCLGSHLARLEANIVLNRLLDRVERIEPAGPVTYATTVSLHGPARVPVRVHAA